MVSPCVVNKCGLVETDKNNYTCLVCKARTAVVRGEPWDEGDIPSGPIIEPLPTSPGRRKKTPPRETRKVLICKTKECKSKATIKGFCRKCYNRDRYWAKKKQKPPNRPKKKPTTKKFPRIKFNLITNPYLSASDIFVAVCKVAALDSGNIEKMAKIVKEQAWRIKNCA